MSETRSPSSPAAGAGWTVLQVVPRNRWRTGADTCSTCGATVELNEPHYQAELDRERSPNRTEKLTRERRLLSFCDEACAADWIEAYEHDA